MKVELQRKALPDSRFNPDLDHQQVRYALPFFKSKTKRGFAHRLRSATHHFSQGKYSHTALSFWCGGSGFMHKGKMYAELPEDQIYCATCEGRAIGAGLDGVREINGRRVLFTPRK